MQGIGSLPYMVCPRVRPVRATSAGAHVFLDPAFFGYQFCTCPAPYSLRRIGIEAACRCAAALPGKTRLTSLPCP